MARKCRKCDKKKVFLYFLGSTQLLCLVLQLMGHFGSTQIVKLVWNRQEKDGLCLYDSNLDEKTKSHFIVAIAFLLLSNVTGIILLVVISFWIFKPTKVIIVRHLMRLVAAILQYYSLMISTWLYTRAVVPGTETWPIWCLIWSFSLSNIPLLLLLFEKVEKPKPALAINIVISEYNTGGNFEHRLYSFPRRICVIMATILAPMSYFGAVGHLTASTVQNKVNATLVFTPPVNLTIPGTNQTLLSFASTLVPVIGAVLVQDEAFSIVLAAQNLTHNQRMTVYTFCTIGASLNFFFVLLLVTAFCAVQAKKYKFFHPTVILGLFVYYSWLIEAWLLSRGTDELVFVDNHSYLFSIAKLAVFNASLIALWGAIIQFDLKRKLYDYEVCSLKDRITTERKQELRRENQQTIAKQSVKVKPIYENPVNTKTTTLEGDYIPQSHSSYQGAFLSIIEPPPDTRSSTPPPKSRTPSPTNTSSTLEMSYMMMSQVQPSNRSTSPALQEEPLYEESHTVSSYESKASKNARPNANEDNQNETPSIKDDYRDDTPYVNEDYPEYQDLYSV